MGHTWLVRVRSCALLAGILFLASLIGANDTPTPDGDEVVPTVEQSAEDSEEQPFIGIELGPSTDGGTKIDRVIPDTAAERFGLEAGDVILRIDDTPTGSPSSVSGAIAGLLT